MPGIKQIREMDSELTSLRRPRPFWSRAVSALSRFVPRRDAVWTFHRGACNFNKPYYEIVYTYGNRLCLNKAVAQTANPSLRDKYEKGNANGLCLYRLDFIVFNCSFVRECVLLLKSQIDAL